MVGGESLDKKNTSKSVNTVINGEYLEIDGDFMGIDILNDSDPISLK